MKRRLMYLAGKIALIAAVGWIVANYMFGVVQVPDAGMYPKLMAGDLLFIQGWRSSIISVMSYR